MGTMEGVRVVEVALYALGPAAAAILSDWGADVVKIEHPASGDPMRSLTYSGIDPGTNGFTFLWEIMNRGKRSVGLDLNQAEGREILFDLIRDADVFLTTLLPAGRRKLGIDVDDVRAANPRIIYARGSAYGPRGPEAEKGGFDALTYWHRTGMSTAVTPDPSQVPALPGPAFGDIQGAMTLASGIAAALFQRERTGIGCVVDTSLFAVGVWGMQSNLAGANLLEADMLPAPNHFSPTNPPNEVYRTAEGRFIALTMPQTDHAWVRLCDVLGHSELAFDERFHDLDARRSNAADCVRALDEIFASKYLAEWCEILQQQDGQWDVVRRVGELNQDAQAWANGYLSNIEYDAERSLTVVPAPVQFDQVSPVLRPAPELGAHTEEVLLELERDWPEIIRLKESQVIS